MYMIERLIRHVVDMTKKRFVVWQTHPVVITIVLEAEAQCVDANAVRLTDSDQPRAVLVVGVRRGIVGTSDVAFWSR